MSPRKVCVTLTYVNLGVKPPVFLAGSFSEPAWHPQEMDYTTNEDGELEFRKDVMVDEGRQHQYKFRIGMGDWWALNEQAPTATDELGNRNNIMAAPMHMPEESFSESSHSDFIPTPPESQSSIPDVVVEKVDDELRHGDDFGESSTTGQKIAHEKRAADAEPDRVIVRSQTSTPIYASTAAEVADSAALLDREASPAPVPDEEAGRTGERRLSSTPIPQVASTAAEVADSAAIIDKDAMKIQMPEFEYNPESFSAQATPGYERAPLFAHECLGPSHEDENKNGDGESEPEVGPLQPDPLLNPPPEKGEEINVNDPTLEDFPQDRISILAHVISTESRLNEDETHFQGVPPSPVATAKSRSTSFDTPSYMQLDAQPSPLLDVITEESQDGEISILKLPSPSEDYNLVKDTNEVPKNEEIGDFDENSKIKYSIVTPEQGNIELIKDLEQSTDVGKSLVAQGPKATEELETKCGSVEAEGAVNIAEPKDSVQVITEHMPVREPPLHAKEASIPIDDAPILSKKDLMPKEKEVEMIGKPSEPVSIRDEQISDKNELKDVVSPEKSTEKELPEQQDGPTEKDTALSSDLRLLSASIGGSAIGGAIIGGSNAKNVLLDKTAETVDIHKTSILQKAPQEPTKLDISTQVSKEINDEPKLPLPSTGVDANAHITDLAADLAAIQIPVLVAQTESKESNESDVPLPKGLDTAKSTSLEDPTINGNIESSLKLRRALLEERSSTPASIHSAIKSSDTRNFFLSIWRTVFVGWIGGLLARLWGRGSGSLLTLFALILVIFAPVLYFQLA